MTAAHKSFEDLTAGAYPPSSRGSADERRAHERSAPSVDITATLQRVSSYIPLRVHVRDLSRAGVGLTVPHAFRIGEQFTLTIPLRPGSLKLHCRTANCRPDRQKNQFIVGAQFITIERNEPRPRVAKKPNLPILRELPPLDPTERAHLTEVESRLTRFLRGQPEQ